MPPRCSSPHRNPIDPDRLARQFPPPLRELPDHLLVGQELFDKAGPYIYATIATSVVLAAIATGDWQEGLIALAIGPIIALQVFLMRRWLLRKIRRSHRPLIYGQLTWGEVLDDPPGELHVRYVHGEQTLEARVDLAGGWMEHQIVGDEGDSTRIALLVEPAYPEQPAILPLYLVGLLCPEELTDAQRAHSLRFDDGQALGVTAIEFHDKGQEPGADAALPEVDLEAIAELGPLRYLPEPPRPKLALSGDNLAMSLCLMVLAPFFGSTPLLLLLERPSMETAEASIGYLAMGLGGPLMALGSVALVWWAIHKERRALRHGELVFARVKKLEPDWEHGGLNYTLRYNLDGHEQEIVLNNSSLGQRELIVLDRARDTIRTQGLYEQTILDYQTPQPAYEFALLVDPQNPTHAEFLTRHRIAQWEGLDARGQHLSGLTRLLLRLSPPPTARWWLIPLSLMFLPMAAFGAVDLHQRADNPALQTLASGDVLIAPGMIYAPVFGLLTLLTLFVLHLIRCPREILRPALAALPELQQINRDNQLKLHTGQRGQLLVLQPIDPSRKDQLILTCQLLLALTTLALLMLSGQLTPYPAAAALALYLLALWLLPRPRLLRGRMRRLRADRHMRQLIFDDGRRITPTGVTFDEDPMSNGWRLFVHDDNLEKAALLEELPHVHNPGEQERKLRAAYKREALALARAMDDGSFWQPGFFSPP